MDQPTTPTRDLFSSPTGTWTRVSPALATMHRITMTIPAAIIGVVAVGIALVVPQLQWIPWLVAASFVVGAVGAFMWAGRNQRAWGYAENDRATCWSRRA